VLGQPVRFQQIPGEAYKARLLERGMSEAMAQGNLDMLVAKDQGLDNAEPRTPSRLLLPASASGARRSSSRPSWPEHRRGGRHSSFVPLKDREPR
jgi:hypothetical protein